MPSKNGLPGNMGLAFAMGLAIIWDHGALERGQGLLVQSSVFEGPFASTVPCECGTTPPDQNHLRYAPTTTDKANTSWENAIFCTSALSAIKAPLLPQCRLFAAVGRQNSFNW